MLDLINRRQFQILIHSYIYYQLNQNIITDSTFDAWCKELAYLIEMHPEMVKQSEYYEAYKEFDGSTGAFLPFNQPRIQEIGNWMITVHKQKTTG